MAEWHMTDLLNKLRMAGWRVEDAEPLEFRCVASWALERSTRGPTLILDFQPGFGANEDFLSDPYQSCGCYLRDHAWEGLYFYKGGRFGKRGKLWKQELERLTSVLNDIYKTLEADLREE